MILRPSGVHGPARWLKAAATQCNGGSLQKWGQLPSSSLQRQLPTGSNGTLVSAVSQKEKREFFLLLHFSSSVKPNFCPWDCICAQALSFLAVQGWWRSPPQIFSYKSYFYTRRVVKTRHLCFKKLIAQNVNTYSWLSHSLLLLCTNLDSRLCSSKCFTERSDTSSCLRTLFAHSYYFNLFNFLHAFSAMYVYFLSSWQWCNAKIWFP